MAKNKNKKQQNDTEFSEEVVAKNAKQTAAGSPSEGANSKNKY
ncbi:hypothetical protein SAMN03159341_103456 [Paenibacillus sp. 1_12]|nr:hypothetical protein [Paenibacillus sp. 1_12]SFL14404.1 hypothetical protein SAMN03159341_103456 [Paenibacillus sp. 1_12]